MCVSSDGACHVMANMMASPEEFDDETASVSVGGGGGTVYGEIGGHHGHHKSSQGLKESRSHGLMMVYAGRMGLNERGCHVASALSALAFALLVIIVSLAICWPGRIILHSRSVYRVEDKRTVYIGFCDYGLSGQSGFSDR